MKERHSASGKPWKLLLAALVGLFIVATAVSLMVAARRVSRVVDTDYYRHGLHYGETHNGGL